MAKQSRRQYTEEFKRAAVKRVEEQGRGIAEVARSLGVHRGQVERWRGQYGQDSTMPPVSSAEFQRNVWRYQDVALAEPVTVTRNGRERLVVLSAGEYRGLKRLDREVLGLDDFTAADLQAIRAAEPPPEAADFDDETRG